MKFGLSNTVKGIIYLAAGLIAFLYTVGWEAKVFHYLMLAGSVASMIYGFLIGGLWQKINNLITALKDNSQNDSDNSKD